MRTAELMRITVFAAAFVFGCSAVKPPVAQDMIPRSEPEVEEAVTKGTVDVIESEMEKNEGYSFSEKKGIIISGMAKYIPAEVNPVSFENFDGEFQFILLDADGNQVRLFRSGWATTEMGEDGKKANVEPNEPFPFTIESKEIDPDDWEKIVNHEFRRWY